MKYFALEKTHKDNLTPKLLATQTNLSAKKVRKQLWKPSCCYILGRPDIWQTLIGIELPEIFEITMGNGLIAGNMISITTKITAQILSQKKDLKQKKWNTLLITELINTDMIVTYSIYTPRFATPLKLEYNI